MKRPCATAASAARAAARATSAQPTAVEGETPGRHLEEGVRTVDLAEVTEMDSSLLALMLAWLRDAKARSRELAFANPPESLRTIARLYGVDGLLPVASSR